MTIHARAFPRPSIRLPSVDRMEAWLRSPEVVGADGTVMSWSNPAHPGYPYPEAAGLWLSHAASDPLADVVAARLCSDARPGVGRGGVSYLFDSAVVLAGLMAYRAAGGRVAVDGAAHGLCAFIMSMVAARSASYPASAGHWSVEFAPHLLKVVKAVRAYDRAYGTTVEDALAPLIVPAANGLRHGPSTVYVHAHCYAVEGLLLLSGAAVAASLPDPLPEIERLASWQGPDGGLPSHVRCGKPAGEPRADATAQAVRLWCLADPDRYARPIQAGLSFLASCQSTSGGIRYEPCSADCNTWATLFATQAATWACGGARVEDLL